MSERHAVALRMPTFFFGHGNPMNALSSNDWSRGWAAVGRRLPCRPRAVLAVSAHWYLPGTALTAMARPRTLHDFGGFPRGLFEVQYAAPGDLTLVRRVRDLLQPLDVRADSSWGLDHGTWSVLRHVFPGADVPVVQLSIDATRPPAFHYGLGESLRPLRDAGILLIGSGNVVHNLRRYAWDGHPVEPFDWALRFEARVRASMLRGDHRADVSRRRYGRRLDLDAERAGRLSIATWRSSSSVLCAASAHPCRTRGVEAGDSSGIALAFCKAVPLRRIPRRRTKHGYN